VAGSVTRERDLTPLRADGLVPIRQIIPTETPMRILILAILAIGTISAADPARAQTYGEFPVCMHVYGPISYYDCSYTSIPQCGASAAGRAAQCVLNPYVANAARLDRPVRRRGVY
jgi:hypothetical protein